MQDQTSEGVPSSFPETGCRVAVDRLGPALGGWAGSLLDTVYIGLSLTLAFLHERSDIWLRLLLSWHFLGLGVAPYPHFLSTFDVLLI